jgi:hypothetical protein
MNTNTAEFTDSYGTVHYPRVQPTGADGSDREPSWDVADVWTGTVSVRAACACGWRGATLATSRAEAGDLDARARQAWEDGHLPHVQAPQVPEDLAAALAAVERLLPAYAASEPLTALRLASELETTAQHAMLQAVTATRRRRGSWDVIGSVLGLSRQTVHARYADRIRAGA